MYSALFNTRSELHFRLSNISALLVDALSATSVKRLRPFHRMDPSKTLKESSLDIWLQLILTVSFRGKRKPFVLKTIKRR